MQAFIPAWWLPGPHLQTLWASLLRANPQPNYHRQRVELDCGDFLDLDWAQPAQNPTSPLVLILHGLEGSSRSGYVRGLVEALQGDGMQCVVMNFRGCSGEPNRLARSYHSGETGDLDQIVRWLVQHFPQRPLFTVGYSLVVNVLLKWLGERGDQAPITAAVAVSVPMLLNICADRMQQGFSRVYLWRLVRDLKKKVAIKYTGPLREKLDLERVKKCRDFWSFDQHVTAPLHGFAGAEDYYQRCSSRQYLGRITCPTLILHAQNDPFMTTAVLPQNDELGAGVRMDISRDGGHVGFISGQGMFGLRPRYWLDQRIKEFIATSLNAAAP